MKLKLSGLQENILLANHTTFRIGGPAKYFFVAKNKDDFILSVKVVKESGLLFYILGGGSNLLVADGGFEGLIIKVQNSNFSIQGGGSTNQPGKALGQSGKLKIIAEAGVLFGKIILETTRLGFSGAEWGFGIPGTIGGAICGNAGRLGQAISNVVKEVTVLDENLNIKKLTAAECEFAYRGSRFKKSQEIIIEAVLEFDKKEQRLIDRVLDEAKDVIKHSPPWPSAGCVFKNYVISPGGAEVDPLLKNHPELVERVRGGHAERGQSPAQLGGKIGVGYLIDQCGLKGYQINDAKIWEGHANYIVNVGGAKAKDILALIKICHDSVKEKFGIELEEEIRYLGNF